jgi:hypothetical protein
MACPNAPTPGKIRRSADRISEGFSTCMHKPGTRSQLERPAGIGRRPIFKLACAAAPTRSWLIRSCRGPIVSNISRMVPLSV